jgi:Putative secretion activating protein
MADFAKCAETTLQFEGVSSDSKYTERNGNASKFGVTVDLAKKASDMDVFDKNSDGKITSKDIQRIDFEDAIAAYKKVYWDCWDLGQLDNQKATLIFDAAMNHGHKMAAKIVQKALIALGFDNVVADGIYGPQTRKSILEVSTEEFIAEYFEVRMAYYNALVEAYSDQKKNLPMWEERLDALKDAISCM